MVTIDQFKAYQTEVAKVVYSSTIQFFTLNDQNIPRAHGSGVLVNIDEHYFVFTAAHVIEDHQGKLHVGIDQNDALLLGGDYIINHHYDRQRDTIDTGIIKLDTVTVDKLTPSYAFITKEELGIDHEWKNLPQYVALGYPATKTKYNPFKNSVKTVPFIFITMPAAFKEYAKNKCDPEHQVLVHYDQNAVVSTTTKLKNKGPDSYGMSGCGFWNTTTNGFIKQNGEKKLVAILTDWPNKHFWMGTRIDIFTEIVRKKYQLNIPVSTVIKVNF